MKKIVVILLAVMLILVLTACGEEKPVMELIDTIGTVSLDSKGAIDAAQSAYDALGAKTQAKVTNVQILKDAQEQYAAACTERDYNEAVDLFRNGEYEQAVEKLTALGNYKDSAAMLNEAKEEVQKAQAYEAACQKMDAGDYVAAANGFAEIRDYKDSEEKIAQAARTLLDKKMYAESIEVYDIVGKAENTVYQEYARGCVSLASAKYDDAQSHFTAAGNIEDASDLYTLCTFLKAEENWDKGYLNTAKALYQNLPEDYSYNNISVKDRLAKLKKFNSFVKLCGKYNCADVKGTVRQKHDSTGIWHEWTAHGYNYGMTLVCYINADDTVTIDAKVDFWHYTNYSSLSKYLKTTNTSETFTYMGTKVPKKLTYSFNWTYSYSGTLTPGKNNTFKFEYKIVDKNSSMNFTYTYKSSGTYKFKSAL